MNGLVIALNRQEVDINNQSAIEEIKNNENIPVVSISILDSILSVLSPAKAPLLQFQFQLWHRP